MELETNDTGVCFGPPADKAFLVATIVFAVENPMYVHPTHGLFYDFVHITHEDGDRSNNKIENLRIMEYPESDSVVDKPTTITFKKHCVQLPGSGIIGFSHYQVECSQYHRVARSPLVQKMAVAT